METLALQDVQVNSYDEVPYQSYSYSMSSPSHLQTIGAIFGMKPPAFEKARVLELGCASGGNLIPHAFYYPNGEYVGVDLSQKQIEQGLETIEALGLKNITLLHRSIMDIDDSLGMFDYIICHGVISWVPEEVRDRILGVIKAHLSPQGIAYVSYNTLPGWNMVRSVRDMMLFHAGNFSSPQERLQQARLFLRFVTENLEGNSTPYADLLRQESALLSQQSDHYLYHDHLEANNHAYYFQDFALGAARHGLQYVGESSLATMYPENMPKPISERLREVNDIIRTEQYMDFITNRRFRMTLLCHNTIPLQREVKPETVKDLSVLVRLDPEQPATDVLINDRKAVAIFYCKASKDHKIETSSPVAKALFYAMHEVGRRPIPISDLVQKVVAKFPLTDKKVIQEEIYRHIAMLLLKDYLAVTVAKPQGALGPMPERPVANPLVAYQALRMLSPVVTTDQHEPLGISVLQRYLLRFLDGQHDKEDWLRAVEDGLRSRELVLSQEGQPIEPDSITDETRQLLRQAIQQSLNPLWEAGCLMVSEKQ
jgi:methyltransferase-like protein/cyclopropane fatty-acyl-phospholipid synthase-like methyltransferase